MTADSSVGTAAPRRHTPRETAFNIVVFVLFAALWVGFAYALVSSQGSLDAAWRWITGLPLILQAERRPAIRLPDHRRWLGPDTA